MSRMTGQTVEIFRGPRRDNRFYVRLTAEEREKLDRAAALAGKLKSQFVMDAVQNAITETYHNLQIIELDREATASLLALIQKPNPVDDEVLDRFKRAPKAVYR